MISKHCRNVPYLHVLLFIAVLSIVILDIHFHLQTYQLDGRTKEQRVAKGGLFYLARNSPRVQQIDNLEGLKESTESDQYVDDSSEIPTPPTIRSRGSKIYHQQTGSNQTFRRISPQDKPPETKLDWVASAKEEPVSRFPKSLLVGFSKCGTSSLLAFLNVHPDIVTLDWETDYFCDRVYFKYSLHWYRMRMPLSTSNQITIEKSPCYITERQALERIRGFNASMKILVILRDPLKRIASQHGQYLASFRAAGKPKQTMEQRYINPHSGKLYDNAVKKWGIFTTRVENLYDLFPREQIHVVDGDKFIRDPLPVLSGIERFLGVQAYFTDEDIHYDKDKGFYCPRYRSSKQTVCMGYQKGRPHVQMSDKLRKMLEDYIRPHTERLFEVIDRRLNWSFMGD